MTVDRREFIERMAGGAAACAGLAAFPPAAEFELAMSGALAQEPWDLDWVSRIRGSHRTVFDCTEIESGAGVLRAMIWRAQYEQVAKVAPEDMTAVVVIRHAAIPLAMTQEFWDRYKIGKAKHVKHPITDQPTTKNPILLTAEAGDLPPAFAKANLKGVLESGGVVLACNLAFRDCVGTIAKEDKVDDAEARKRAIGMC